MKEKYVEFQHEGDTLEAYLAVDANQSTPLPAVMISHTWRGRSDFECDKARTLAALGFVGFAIDMYGKGVLGQTPDESATLMQPFMDDRAKLQGRMLAALEALKAQEEADTDKVVAAGYCFGGLCVLDLARTGVDIAGVASFHGLLQPPGNLSEQKIRSKVLILHGNDDPMAPTEHVVEIQKELTAAGADWQLHNYGNTMHAFTNPQANDPDFGTVYSEKADQRSWRSFIRFLDEAFESA
ncbi:MAG: dienelactone hydrolase family protein [Gammaproteobacteria bacterium]